MNLLPRRVPFAEKRKTSTKDNFFNSDSTLPISSVDACKGKFHENFLFRQLKWKSFPNIYCEKVFSLLYRNCNNIAIYLSSCKENVLRQLKINNMSVHSINEILINFHICKVLQWNIHKSRENGKIFADK